MKRDRGPGGGRGRRQSGDEPQREGGGRARRHQAKGGHAPGESRRDRGPGRRMAPEAGRDRDHREADTDLETGAFETLLRAEIEKAGPPPGEGGWDYARELEAKHAAFSAFWKQAGLPDKPNRILPSPLPRHYRTTSKRKAAPVGGKVRLRFADDWETGRHPAFAKAGDLEPEAHAALYAFLEERLNTPPYAALAHALHFASVRGSYGEFAVIITVAKLGAAIVHQLKLLAGHLREPPEGVPAVISAFAVYDPTRSDYYLDTRPVAGPWKVKKLYGPDKLRLEVGENRYSYHISSFSQVNASILPPMVEKLGQFLKPRPHQRLLDLYCGYGLFSWALAGGYGQVYGVDVAKTAIEAAQEQPPARAGGKAGAVRFRAGAITAESLDRLLPPADQTQEAVLLDPPRQGTAPGVIRALAERQPHRVAHVFCDVEVMPRELNQWRKRGYMISKAQPLDMFPGTGKLEVVVLLIRDQFGLLAPPGGGRATAPPPRPGPRRGPSPRRP